MHRTTTPPAPIPSALDALCLRAARLKLVVVWDPAQGRARLGSALAVAR